ncbi:MAG TPA: RcnB family protein [Vitreimonas sp.]|nr:RcnB family protein [Vitreimonas sp.]
MKRLLMTALAAATFAAPLALPTDATAHERGRGHRHNDRDRDWDRDRDDDDRDYRRDRRDRRHYREGRRDQRRWDRSRYNGYTYRGQWYYGPPPSSYDYRYVDYGYRAWRRGDRLPRYYRDYYRPVDYRYYRLRQPPRGYHYVRDDRGDYLLVGIATGVILGVILAGN